MLMISGYKKKNTHLDSTRNLTEKIVQYFPNTTVYPMFGNHEPFPADQYDFTTNSTRWLSNELADLWKMWLDDQAYNTFRELTFYSMVNTKYNLKMIALDTLACDTNDFYLIKNPTDPNGQLAWLKKELLDAESRNLSVIIIGHIPPGDKACQSGWSARYRAIVDRFTNIIRTQFFGHNHDDHFQLTRSWNDSTPVNTAFISPSLTTYSNLLPSFRIYVMDAETNTPLNYYQYRLDLAKWNAHTTGPIEWDLVYNALNEYNLTDLSHATMDNLAERIKTDTPTTLKFATHQHSGAQQYIDNRQLQNMYCTAKFSVASDMFHCLGVDASTGDMMEMAKQLLPGAWSYDKC